MCVKLKKGDIVNALNRLVLTSNLAQPVLWVRRVHLMLNEMIESSQKGMGLTSIRKET